MTDISTLNRLLDLTVAIQQIPAPTFQEGERAAFIQERFQAESLQDVSMDQAGNVYGRLPGAGKSRPLVVSAHLDTVFPLTTDLHITRHHTSSAEGPILSGVAGPGIGDNSLGVAALFGLLWELRRLSAGQAQAFLPGDIWFVANVGEEGLGNLCGMRRVVDRFDSQPLAYLIVEGMSLGQVYHRGLGVQRYAIKVDTPGGHSWVDYGRPSAIHILAEIVTHLSSLALPAKPRTTLNVGTISGGTTVNTVAAHAQLELDLRSESPAVLARLADQVEEMVQQARRPKVQVTAEVIGQRPPGEIPPNHPLVRLAVACLEELDVLPRLNIGSTDANIPLSRGLPAICLGLTHGSGSHTIAESIQTGPLETGLQQLVNVVRSIFQKL